MDFHCRRRAIQQPGYSFTAKPDGTFIFPPTQRAAAPAFRQQMKVLAGFLNRSTCRHEAGQRGDPRRPAGPALARSSPASTCGLPALGDRRRSPSAGPGSSKPGVRQYTPSVAFNNRVKFWVGDKLVIDGTRRLVRRAIGPGNSGGWKSCPSRSVRVHVWNASLADGRRRAPRRVIPKERLSPQVGEVEGLRRAFRRSDFGELTRPHRREARLPLGAAVLPPEKRPADLKLMLPAKGTYRRAGLTWSAGRSSPGGHRPIWRPALTVPAFAEDPPWG